jgi:hypothetical protein
MQRCRSPVDPRDTAVTATGRSQRTRIRSGIFDFRSVHLIQKYIEVTKATVTVDHQRNISRVVKFLETRKILLSVGEYWLLYNK